MATKFLDAAGLKYVIQKIKDLLDGKLSLSGGTMTGALNFKNTTWNLVGDDSYVGDKDIAGTFCVKGANGATGIALVNQKNESDYGLISYSGGNIKINKAIDANITGNAATATKATQDASGNVITTTYETKTDANASHTAL